MPATLIAERIGWEHGLTVLKDWVRVLRPYYVPPKSCLNDQAQWQTFVVADVRDRDQQVFGEGHMGRGCVPGRARMRRSTNVPQLVQDSWLEPWSAALSYRNPATIDQTVPRSTTSERSCAGGPFLPGCRGFRSPQESSR